MARSGISADMLASLNAVQAKPGHLMEVYFDAGDGGPVYLTDFYTASTWNANTYTAAGHLLSYDGIEENVEMQAALARVVLSGVDQQWIERVLAKSYLNRRLVIRKATLNASWQVVIDPVPAFDGLMKQPQIVDDPDNGSCQVMISASHDASDVNNGSGRRTNDQVQQLHFSGDGFFKFANQADKQIIWGGGVSAQQTATQVGAAVDWGDIGANHGQD